MENEYEIIDSPKALLALESASIDKQIATAKAYPRSLEKFNREMATYACMDKETAETMFYTLPRKDANGKKVNIIGRSARFAEIVQMCFGNLIVDSRVIAIEHSYVTAQGTCRDLERNTGHRVEVKVRITTKEGKRYGDDGIQNACNSACSKAARNAVLKVVPSALTKKIFEKCKLVAKGEKSLEQAREDELKRWDTLKVTRADLFELLGIEGELDINVDILIQMIGFRNSIADGETTLDKLLGKEKLAEQEKSKKVTKPSDKMEKPAEQEKDNSGLTEEEKAAIIEQERKEAEVINNEQNKLPFVVSDWVLAQKLRPLEIIILAIIESRSRFADDKLKEQTDVTNKQLTNYVYKATINTVRMAVYRLKQKKTNKRFLWEK